MIKVKKREKGMESNELHIIIFFLFDVNDMKIEFLADNKAMYSSFDPDFWTE